VATDLHSFVKPALKAGCPQHVWLVLYETSQHAFSKTFIMLKAVSGKSWSTKQGMNN
jgi:hypothetical protein